MSFERPIYPTNGLRFLNNPDYYYQESALDSARPILLPNHHANPGPGSISCPSWIQTPVPAKLPLGVNIVGAGLGGLATAITLTLSGHKVTLFEQAPAFGEVGAGIQVPPNSTRYLLAWGVGPHIEPHISEPEGIRIRRWQNGEVIGMTPLLRHGNESKSRAGFREKFGAPYFVVHRADYHAALVARCRELAIDIREGCEVVGYEFDQSMNSASAGNGAAKVSLVLKNGTRHYADLIIAADGLKSPARTEILLSHDLPPAALQSAVWAAYRATVPLSQLQAHPATNWITQTPNQNLWIGPSHHAMTYSIGGLKNPNRIFNLVLSHSEARPPEQWSTDPVQVRREMKAHYVGWDERLLSVLDCVVDSSEGRVVKWPIMTIPPLKTWVHASKRLVVLGDAAHAMVPFMSQGAAIAVEDAAAISALLALVESEEEIGPALECFERVRIPRASGMQQAGKLNGEIWHLEDGELQQARDEAMKWSVSEEAEVNGANGVRNKMVDYQERDGHWDSNQWSDPLCQAWTYGYDAAEEVTRAWSEWKDRKK